MLKKAEIKVRKILNGLMKGRIKPQLIYKPTDIFNTSTAGRILLLRHDRIGDAIISIPFIKYLKAVMPSAETDILLSKKNRQTSDSLSEYINNIYTYDKSFIKIIKLILNLRKRHYDLIIDLLDNESATSNILLKFVRSKYKLGFDKENRGNYTHVIELPDKSEYHIIERLGELLMPFGLDPDKLDFDLNYKLSDKYNYKPGQLSIPKNKLRIGINLSGSGRAKYWGTKNIIDFINRINNDNKFEILLFGTSDYSKEKQEISSHSNSKSAPETKSFNEYAAGLKTCDLIITPDTAAVHLASAFKIPCIVLYRVRSDRKLMPWYPYKSPFVSVEIENKNIDQIKIDEVISAFYRLLEKYKIDK